MPDDRAISVRPASTHGMPAAPSAARFDRLRRPIAIIAPHAISPNTPAISDPPFHHASHGFTLLARPGSASGAGFGTPPAKPFVAASSAGWLVAAWAARACMASAWMSADIVSSSAEDQEQAERSVGGQL